MTMVTTFKMTFGIMEEKQCLEVTYAIYYAIGMLTGTYLHAQHSIRELCKCVQANLC